MPPDRGLAGAHGADKKDIALSIHNGHMPVAREEIKRSPPGRATRPVLRPGKAALSEAQAVRKNAWRQEDQQFGLVVEFAFLVEQPAHQRYVRKERYLGDGTEQLLLVDTADDHRLAVVQQHLGSDFLLFDGAVLRLGRCDA